MTMFLQDKILASGIGPGLAQAMSDSVDLLTASGTTQDDAYEIRNAINRFSTVASGAGAKLWRSAQPGDEILVYNAGANPLTLYPNLGSSIEANAVNASVSIPAGTQARFTRHNATLWSMQSESSVDVSYTPVSGTFAGIATTVQTWLDRLLTGAATTGADLVGVIQSGTGAVATTLQTRGRYFALLTDFGADPTGVSDCSGAVNLAAAAVAAGSISRRVFVPAGVYKFTVAPSTLTNGVVFEGLSSRGVGADTSSTLSFTTFKHSYNGDFFTIQGTDGVTGSGGGFKYINFVQANGAPGSTNGNAIKWTATASQRPSWVELDGCNFEVATGAGDWTRGPYIDASLFTGTAGQGDRDFYIKDVRIVTGAGSTNALEFNNVQNFHLINVSGNGSANFDMKFTGPDATHKSQGWLTNCFGAKLDLDYANGVQAVNCTFTDLTGTANTTSSLFRAGVLTNAPTLSGTGLTVEWIDGSGNWNWKGNTALFQSGMTITGHPTFEGVTSTGATGTGNLVYSISPTFTGTANFANAAATGAVSSKSDNGIVVGSAGIISDTVTAGFNASIGWATAGTLRWVDDTLGTAGSEAMRRRYNGGGVAQTWGQAGAIAFPNISTTASAANAFLDNAASNNLLRSTSSLRYKTAVEPIDHKFSDAVLQLNPIWYRSLASADRKDWSWYGLGAEDVAKLDPRLVHWVYRDTKRVKRIAHRPAVLNEAGELVSPEVQEQWDTVPDADSPLIPDGVQYERVAVLLLDVVKRMDSRIKTLESK